MGEGERATVKKPANVRFRAANYVDRVNDAVFVELGETTVYFCNQKVIALMTCDTFYRVEGLENGTVYKRIRSAAGRHQPRKIHQMKRDELNAMVEVAIMAMASKLVDNRLMPETT